MPILLFKTKNQPPTHQDASAPALDLFPFYVFFFFTNCFFINYHYVFLPVSAYPSSSALFPLDLTLCTYMPQCPPLLPQPHDSAANCTITKSLISRVAVSWLCLRDRNRARKRGRNRERESNHINETKKQKKEMGWGTYQTESHNLLFCGLCMQIFPQQTCPPMHVTYMRTYMWSLWKTGDGKGSWQLSVPTDPQMEAECWCLSTVCSDYTP